MIEARGPGVFQAVQALEMPQAPLQAEWICRSFVEALTNRNARTATACFARDACLVTQDATVIRGRDHIRPLLRQLIDRGIQIRLEFSNTLIAGGVALAQERWTIHVEGTEGRLSEQTWMPTLVLRQIEQEWKLAVAAPWGWGYRFTL
jgi:ketosteroid isomerase-like protein